MVAVPVEAVDYAAAVVGAGGMTHPLVQAVVRRLAAAGATRAEIKGCFMTVYTTHGFDFWLILCKDALAFDAAWREHGLSAQYADGSVEVQFHDVRTT